MASAIQKMQRWCREKLSTGLIYRTLNVAKLQSPLVDCKDCRNLFHVWPRPSLEICVHVFERVFEPLSSLRSVDAASAKREVQEAGTLWKSHRSQPWWNDWTSLLQVVMTPFLQRYMAYMVSLGINFEQALPLPIPRSTTCICFVQSVQIWLFWSVY